MKSSSSKDILVENFFPRKLLSSKIYFRRKFFLTKGVFDEVDFRQKIDSIIMAINQQYEAATRKEASRLIFDAHTAFYHAFEEIKEAAHYIKKVKASGRVFKLIDYLYAIQQTRKSNSNPFVKLLAAELKQVQRSLIT